MSDTTYTDFGTPPIGAAWLNDINIAVYRALGASGVAPTTAAQVISNLGLGATTTAHGADLIGVYDPAGAWPTDTVGAILRLLGSDHAVTPFDFGAVGDGVTDDTAAITAWGTKVYGTGVPVAALIGNFKITSALTFTGAATKLILWGATLTCSFTTETAAVNFVSNADVAHVGKLIVNGPGTAGTYSTYTIGQGVSVQSSGVGCYGHMLIQRFKYQGLDASSGISDDTTFGNIEVFDIGCYNGSVSTLTATVSARVDNGSSNSLGQTSTLTVSAQPPAGLTAGDGFVIIAGNPHVVTAVNAGAGTINVFPWPDLTFTTGTISYIVGQGVRTGGVDDNVLGMDVNAIRCGIGLHSHSLYGAAIGRLQTQACACAIGVGVFNNSDIGLKIGATYFESSNLFNVLVFTTGDTNMVIEGIYSNPVDYSKWVNVSAPRSSGTLPTGNFLSPTFTKIKGVVVGNDTVLYPAPQTPGSQTNSAETLSIGASPSVHAAYKANTLTVNLQSALNLNRISGLTDVWFAVTGTGTNNAPTGTITVQPTSSDSTAGYTVNGGASSAFTGFTGPVLFNAYLDNSTSGKNWTVTLFEGKTIVLPKNTGAITPLSVAANTIAEQTFAVNGLVTTDAVSVSEPAAQTAGIGIVGCRVSSANTLAIRFINNTAGALTPLSGTYRLAVYR